MRKARETNMSVTETRSKLSETAVQRPALLRVERNIRKYLDEVRDVLQRIPVSDIRGVVDALILAYSHDTQIFIMGNGGSAATATAGGRRRIREDHHR